VELDRGNQAEVEVLLAVEVVDTGTEVEVLRAGQLVTVGLHVVIVTVLKRVVVEVVVPEMVS
jgi:hypothetical protein